DGIRDFHVTGVQTCALPIYVLELGVVAVRVVAQEFAMPVGDGDAIEEGWAAERVKHGIGAEVRLDLGEPIEVDGGEKCVDRGDVRHTRQRYLSCEGAGGLYPVSRTRGRRGERCGGMGAKWRALACVKWPT